MFILGCLLTNYVVTAIPIDNCSNKTIRNVTIPMLGGGNKQYRIKIYDVGFAKHPVTDSDIGKNDASLDEVKSSYVFGSKEEDTDGCDISMIIGEFSDSPEKVLLNLRFHKKVDGAKEFGEKFMRHAMKHISVGKGFKEVRQGVICLYQFFISYAYFLCLFSMLFGRFVAMVALEEQLLLLLILIY